MVLLRGPLRRTQLQEEASHLGTGVQFPHNTMARRVRLTGGRHCGVGGNVGSNPARGG